MNTMTLNERLSYHCNKAIEQGNGPIAGIPAEIEILSADRSEHNESNGKGMSGCIAKAGSVIAYFPTQSAFQSAPVLAAAPELLSALKEAVVYLETFACHDEQGRAAIKSANAAIAKADFAL